MSHAAIAPVLARHDLSAGERLVAWSLASFANRDQRAWPGIPAATARAGERRWRAAKLAGESTIPPLVDAMVDHAGSLELAIIENLVRKTSARSSRRERSRRFSRTCV